MPRAAKSTISFRDRAPGRARAHYHRGDGFTDAGEVGPYLAPVTPLLRDARWRLLGFDVADGSLVSGLANCGYSPLEAAGLRQQWRARLNDNHLFVDVEQALHFKHLSDRRIPEHAPFFVHGLFTIETSS